jgi:hypothetical protein
VYVQAWVVKGIPQPALFGPPIFEDEGASPFDGYPACRKRLFEHRRRHWLSLPRPINRPQLPPPGGDHPDTDDQQQRRQLEADRADGLVLREQGPVWRDVDHAERGDDGEEGAGESEREALGDG